MEAISEFDKVTLDRSMSGFDKERRRARYAARYTIDRNHIGPAYYDIFYLKTFEKKTWSLRKSRPDKSLSPSRAASSFLQRYSQEWSIEDEKLSKFLHFHADGYILNNLHPLSIDTYFVEKIDGDTFANNLMRYDKDTNVTIGTILQEIYNLSKNPVSNGDIEISKYLTYLEIEIYSRTRWLIAAYHSIVMFGKKLWDNGFYHCDFHAANILIRNTHISDISTLNNLLKQGNAFILNLGILKSSQYNEEDMTDFIFKQNASEIDVQGGPVDGVKVVEFSARNIVLIDFAFAIQISNIIKEKGTENIFQPCKQHRFHRNEDIVSIAGYMLHIVYPHWSSRMKDIIQSVQELGHNSTNRTYHTLRPKLIFLQQVVDGLFDETNNKNEHLNICTDDKTNRRCSVEYINLATSTIVNALRKASHKLLQGYTLKNNNFNIHLEV